MKKLYSAIYNQFYITFLISILTVCITRTTQMNLPDNEKPIVAVIESDMLFQNAELNDIATNPDFTFAFLPDHITKHLLLIENALKKKQSGIIISNDFQNICSRIKSGFKSISYEEALKAIPEVIKLIKNSKDKKLISDNEYNDMAQAFKKYNKALKTGKAAINVRRSPSKHGCANTVVVTCNAVYHDPNIEDLVK